MGFISGVRASRLKTMKKTYIRRRSIQAGRKTMREKNSRWWVSHVERGKRKKQKEREERGEIRSK